MTRNYTFTISYGKSHVPLYRVYAQPLTGITAIPESTFTGRPNTLFALEVDVEVFGNNFLPAYLVGDNSSVVATDSMKNFILRQGLNYTGSTFEGLLEMLGQRFLETYPQMERLQLRLRGRLSRREDIHDLLLEREAAEEVVQLRWRDVVLLSGGLVERALAADLLQGRGSLGIDVLRRHRDVALGRDVLEHPIGDQARQRAAREDRPRGRLGGAGQDRGAHRRVGQARIDR